jgi:MoaA/NifB/PqqE/SkfB family radical SAM enzyme
MDPALLAPLPGFLILELTTRCQLRCLYCALSQPGFHGRDLEFDRERLLAELDELGIRHVQVSGHGEATIVPGWHLVAAALQDAGIRVQLTTNLAKRLAPEELAVFRRLQCITVSCDTVDPVLFERLRRPAKFERMEENLARLLEQLPARGAERPHLAINCTYSAPVVDGLPELLRWGSARGFDAVSLVNLFEYPAVDPAFPVLHPARVDPARALQRIGEAAALARELGLEFHVMDGLHTELEEALAR